MCLGISLVRETISLVHALLCLTETTVLGNSLTLGKTLLHPDLASGASGSCSIIKSSSEIHGTTFSLL